MVGCLAVLLPVQVRDAVPEHATSDVDEGREHDFCLGEHAGRCLRRGRLSGRCSARGPAAGRGSVYTRIRTHGRTHRSCDVHTRTPPRVTYMEPAPRPRQHTRIAPV